MATVLYHQNETEDESIEGHWVITRFAVLKRGEMTTWSPPHKNTLYFLFFLGQMGLPLGLLGRRSQDFFVAVGASAAELGRDPRL